MNERFKRISMELIDRGDVKKCIVTSLKDVEDIVKNVQLKKYIPKLLNEGYTLEILAVAPFASVRKHYHPNCWEIRINIDTFEYDSVKIHKYHEWLKNNTNKEQYYLCIKGDSKLEMPNIEEIIKN